MLTALGSFVVILISVYLLAIITEEFFIIALDEISTRFELPSDVAGASLMAMGSSAPELFIALIAVFRGGAHSEVGIGTIVGSAIFNVLVITGISAIVAKEMFIKAGAVERDIFVYLGSVGILLFVFIDGTIVLWEALMMMAVYVGYLVLLYFWGRSHPDDPSEKAAQGQHSEQEEATGFFGKLSHLITQLFAIIMPNPKKNYVWVMVASIGFIVILSYILVENAVIMANALNLPPLIVSLTLLAAGTSAPDLIASIDVARDGRGTMAISNAIGSNIFDVLVGLGVPWLITIIALSQSVEVGTDGLIESVILLIVTVVILYIFLYTRRTLTRMEGIALLVTYVIYIMYAIYTSSGGTIF